MTAVPDSQVPGTHHQENVSRNLWKHQTHAATGSTYFLCVRHRGVKAGTLPINIQEDCALSLMWNTFVFWSENKSINNHWNSINPRLDTLQLTK